MVNALVYSEDGAKEAAAAGYILLSMVAVSTWRYENASLGLMRYRWCGSSTLDQPIKHLTAVT